jgi:hypothetical protein
VVTVLNEGTWTLNTSTGVVTFVPLASFAGVATPVSYVGADVVGQVFDSVLNATITPAASPAAPVAPSAPEAPVASVPAITAATTTPPVVTVLKKSLLPRTGASGLTALGLLGLALLFLGTESKRRSRLRNL